MDILYVVGTGSKWDNNELRYSLRSIDKYGINIDRVFIVGTKPDFVNNTIHYIPCGDPYPRKHKNILHKVIKAITTSDIGRHFLISSDDHFYVRETDFANLPVYYRNEEIPASYKADKMNNYTRSLLDTRALLKKYGFPIYQTNPHCNTHFRTDYYERNKHIFDEAFALEYGGELNCIMGNIFIANGAVPTPFNDSKLTKARTNAELKERLQDIECFSIGDKALKWGIQDYLTELFPHKSKYEK